jgi:hypothetical protein
MVNYGAQLVYRSQDYATFNITPIRLPYSDALVKPLEYPLTSTDLGNSITTNVNALLFIPSLWFKLGWKALTLEFEGNMLAARWAMQAPCASTTPTTDDQGLTILQAGWVLASQLKLYNDSLFIGFETGGATGDQAELAYGPNTQVGNSLYYPYLNYRWKFVPQPRGDRT